MRKPADQIIKAQLREITEMKTFAAELEENSAAGPDLPPPPRRP